MRILAPEEVVSFEKQLLWFLLSLQAGFVNTFGFLDFGSFVSHVTGFSSRLGIELYQHQYLFAIEILLVPISFILGGMFAAFILELRFLTHRMVLAQVMQFLIYIIILILGHLGLLGEYGDQLRHHIDFIGLSLLCFVCGLQNATYAIHTKGMVRTTHMTGVATDLAINFVRMLKSHEIKSFLHERTWFFLKSLQLFFFTIGSIIAAWLTFHFGFYSILFVMGTNLFLLIVAIGNDRRYFSITN